jgi:four helix bundle protein
MTYKRFEDLPVWQEAIRLAEECEDFLIDARDLITFSKRDQLDRCSLSVSNNIAEGFERGTSNELLAFLYIARGSAGEVRSMLCYFERRPALRDFQSRISNLKSLAESCSRQIRAWADSLQNSDIKGQRHLNDQNLANWKKAQNSKASRARAAEFERELMSKLAPDHPMRVAWEKKHGLSQ